MLHDAVRLLLDRSGGRTPSHDAWAVVLLAAGVDPAQAATLPQRLGYVFHIGRYDEHDVITQLDAWVAALRVRAEPETAAVVEAAVRRLREEPWPVSGPQPPRVGGEPDTHAPVAPQQAPSPPPVSGPPTPRAGDHPDTRSDPFAYPQQAGGVSGHQPPRAGGQPDTRRARRGAETVLRGGARARRNRTVPIVVGVISLLLLVCLCGVGLEFVSTLGTNP